MEISELIRTASKVRKSASNDLAAKGATSDIASRAAYSLGIAERLEREMNRLSWIEKPFRIIEQFNQADRVLADYSFCANEFLRERAQGIEARLSQILQPGISALSEFSVGYRQQFDWLQTFAADDLFKDLELYLLSESWYLSVELPFRLILTLDQLLEQKESAKIERVLCNFFRRRVCTIQELVERNFPHRRRHISDAFEAHQSGKFSLSVPAFLGQADGISRELWNESFFRKARSDARIKHLCEQNDFSATVIRHLLEEGALRSSGRRRGKQILNRHSTLHGTSLDFDTEANSLRCISLLEFFTTLKPLFEGHQVPG
jgi:hypothetical protein